MPDPGDFVVVEAKLRPPRVLPGAVMRAALAGRLDAGSVGALRAVIAPAGWGKSQLIAQWLAERQGPVAYVAVDPADRDPTRFWRHLLTAIGRCGVDIDDLIHRLRAPALPLEAEIVEPLVDRLADHDMTVVIEDLHLLEGVEVIESLESFVDIVPPAVTLAVVSRTDPHLHLPRRRVAGMLIEIGVGDLRLSAADTAAVVGHTTGVEPGDEIVGSLVTTTEGWPTGVYLAGLSLRSSADPAGFVEGFAGDDRLISDYLASEVLAKLDDDRVRFLTQSAVLTELDAATCNELLDRDDAAGQIEALVRTNVFVIPTDEHGRSYRYHHLFRDWLLIELDRREPRTRTELHRRAARLFDRRGDPQEAVDHAIAADDHAFGLSVAGRAAPRLLREGALATVAHWDDSLVVPDEHDGQLRRALLRAWIAVIEGDVDAVHRWCWTADAHLDALESTDENRVLAGDRSLLVGYAHLLEGAFAKAVAELQVAAPVGVRRPAEATLAWARSAARYWLGEHEIDGFRDALTVSVRTADMFALVLVRGYLANSLLDIGDRTGAQSSIDVAFEVARSNRLESFGHMAMAHVARARLNLEIGDAASAEADCGRAIDLAGRRGDRPVDALAHLMLARAMHAVGRDDPASPLRLARQEIRALPDTGLLHELAAVTERQLRMEPLAPPPGRLPVPIEALTNREMALLRLLPGTLRQREMGEALNVSFNTVKTYNRQIYRKLGVTSRVEAVAVARRLGLL
ncbi:MAG: LuxR C-terminal-related transcriptional regulator [Actinomycetota bacterium]